MEKETRILSEPLEVREAEDGTRTLVGYGAVFGKFSQDLGGFREIIDPAAFNRTIQNQKDILVTVNHNVDRLLGRTAAGTARVNVDEVGVRYEVDIPDTMDGRDAMTLATRGDLFGSSFTFATVADDWAKDEDGRRVRTLKEVRLFELGPVVSPAYLDTTVALRSMDALEEETLEEETIEEDETRDKHTLNPAQVASRFTR